VHDCAFFGSEHDCKPREFSRREGKDIIDSKTVLTCKNNLIHCWDVSWHT
jgi:hypothetical protein